MSGPRQCAPISGPRREKNQFAAELAPGDTVADVFFLRDVSKRTARNGEPFLALRLSDRSGTIDGRAWGDDARHLEGVVTAGSYYHCEGSVVSFRGGFQVNIRRAAPCAEGSVDPADFLPSSYRDRDELIGFIQYFIAEVYDQDYRTLLESFFGDDAFLSRFRQAPGDARSHHAYLGGLLEHTVSVATLCQHVTVQHPRVNSDLLITAALLHDIGKVQEFEYEGAISYSREGRLLGHVLLGQRMIEERIRSLEGFPAEKELQLVHALISHHGELEWGAPKR
ncbi:MAG: 3'-5' exoribonuclease YhaM family protein, partial [Thermoleophilia bacterium]